MKKIYVLLVLSFLVLTASAQVNLPHTLTFTADDAAAWSDGIAQDGDGGSQNIIGLDIEIFTATSAFAFATGSTIMWKENDYFTSGEAGYTAITSGPDPDVTNNGVAAMILRSSNQGVNFSLQSIQLYDWGYTESGTTIATYDNGVLLGTITVAYSTDPYLPTTITQADELTPGLFSDIDEIRFYSPDDGSPINLSMNNISLASPGALPVKYEYFRGQLDERKGAELEWATSQEQNSSHFDVERSIDGTQFQKVGRVEAQGNSSITHSYRFVHPATNDPLQIFRLRQVDLDKKETLSSLVTLRARSAIELKAGPNPTKGTIQLESNENDILSIGVFNAAGSRNLFLKGLHSKKHSIDLSSLPNGVYYIHVQLETGSEKLKVVKE